MTVPVAWLPLGPDGPASRGAQWDLALLDEALSGRLWHPAGWPGFEPVDSIVGGGGVAVVPGRYWAGGEAKLDAALADSPWTVALVTSDEESTLDAGWAPPGRGARWTMTPRPGVHPAGRRFLGEGWSPEAPRLLAGMGDAAAARPLDWFFAGQVTHDRRRALVRRLHGTRRPGRLVETDGFTAGLPASEYMLGMASAKVAPCPSGPATPDSFRVYEALEAGCVPVADGRCPAYVAHAGYWRLLLGADPPFPVADDWSEWPALLEAALDGWPARAAACSAWWQAEKRDLCYRLMDDCRLVGGVRRADGGLVDLVTVVVTVSPTPEHPSTAMVADTLASVRSQAGLEGCEALVACDGVRPGLTHRSVAYGEHLRALAWRCEHEWGQTLPVVLPEWRHQAGAVAAALALVRTPLVLMVEHDTPMCGDVDWPAVAGALLAGRADLVRFHHEAHVLEPHRHLMLDDAPVDLGFPALRTIQWSQRPHLARAGYYRRILAEHFADRVGFVEDTMHGVVQDAWAADGFAGWRRHKLALYAPPGDIKRSLHSDGRGGDVKAPGWVSR